MRSGGLILLADRFEKVNKSSLSFSYGQKLKSDMGEWCTCKDKQIVFHLLQLGEMKVSNCWLDRFEKSLFLIFSNKGEGSMSNITGWYIRRDRNIHYHPL